MSKETLEVLAGMTDTKVDIREQVETWLMVTYDLPHSEAGDKARREFLQEARTLGAEQHTESVYLMPWTPDAEILVLHLSRVYGGKVIVWTSQTTDPAQAKEITRKYDQGLVGQIEDLKERMEKITDHVHHRRFKRAEKMFAKTERELENLRQAVNRRGSQELIIWVALLERQFMALSAMAGGG